MQIYCRGILIWAIQILLGTTVFGGKFFQILLASLPNSTAFLYFMMQACLHIVINYLRLPETDQNMMYLSRYQYRIPQNSMKT